MNELQNLLPETASVLKQLSTLELLEQFTFVGGSGLAVHLGHRLSEDIDLFSWEKQLDIRQIQRSMDDLNFEQTKLINLSTTQADYIVNGVKLTFFADNRSSLKQRSLIFNHLHVADLPTLAAMKINTLFLRAKYRDYYDLYVLNLLKFSLQEMYDFTSSQMKNLTVSLFQRALGFVNDIEDENIDHLKPIYKLKLQQIEKHFEKQIKLWNKTLKK